MSKRSFFSFIPLAFRINGHNVETKQMPEDIVSLKMLYEIVTRWCISNDLLILTKVGDRYVPNIAEPGLENRIRNFIYNLNLKYLGVSTNLNEALVLFEDTEYDHLTSRLIDLHIRIVTEVDPRFINIYINKLVYTLDLLYKDNELVDLSWERDILPQHPFLWLLFIIQTIMRDSSPV